MHLSKEKIENEDEKLLKIRESENNLFEIQ
jgi:hypothetical protein